MKSNEAFQIVAYVLWREEHEKEGENKDAK